jgi:hypothetical protein
MFSQGPTYLPPTKPPVSRSTTTTPIRQRTYTYGTYSIPRWFLNFLEHKPDNKIYDSNRYTFRYTYPTYVPTRTPSRSRPTYTYTTTEGYPYRPDDPRLKGLLYGSESKVENKVVPAPKEIAEKEKSNDI